MNIEHLPTDLIFQIISRLPAKSVARCRCVSKLWASLLTLGSPYFTELFLTHSKTRPRLLFAVKRNDKWLLYSCPQPQISYKSPFSVTAEVQMSFPKALDLQGFYSVSGKVYCPRDNNNGRVFCNPSTGQILCLPELEVGENFVRSYIGYDPIDKQFIILLISYNFSPSLEELSSNYRILKIGSGKELIWRNLECPLQPHIPSYINTCFNGVLYYVAKLGSPFRSRIVCFDYKSEEFKFIDEPWDYKPNLLVNFKGKLCGLIAEWVQIGERYDIELDLWILDDFEKEKWSVHSYCMMSGLCKEKYKNTQVRVVGVSVTGDIVFSSVDKRNYSFYVYFFNLEKNSLKEVEIKCLERFNSIDVSAFIDNVEDLRLY